MVERLRLRVLVTSFAALAAVSLLGLPRVAHAGSLDVQDRAGILSPEAQGQLRATAATLPFDVRVLTDIDSPNRAVFDARVRAALAGPNFVTIGVDPVHRMTSVHFGVGTRVGAQYFRAIEDSGDAFFRRGEWAGGIGAILTSAGAYVGSGPVLPPAGYVPRAYPYGVPPGGYVPNGGYVPYTRAPNPVPAGDGGGSSAWPWILGLVVIGGVIAITLSALRRARAAQAASGGYHPGNAPGYGPTGYGPPGYGAPPSGVSPVGAGLIGAGVGGLIGYELGRHAAGSDEHVEVNTYSPVGSYESPATYNSGSSDGGSSWDAGGSSSGWDSGDSGGGGGGDSGGGGGIW